MGFSNHRKPILLEPDDRRFYVVHTTAKRQLPPYYDALYEALDAEIPALVHMLKQRDVSQFNPDAPPPDTPDKAELIADSYTPVKAKLLELIEAGEGQFASDITSLSLIRIRLEMFQELKPRALETRNLQRTLKELGGIPLGPVRVGDKKPSLWAIRNAGKWDGALPSDIRQEYLRK